MRISEEAVVAGAKAMDAYWGGRYAPDEVEELRGEVTAMLEAAAPIMLAPLAAEVAYYKARAAYFKYVPEIEHDPEGVQELVEEMRAARKAFLGKETP